jgi:hypothetical protein
MNGFAAIAGFGVSLRNQLQRGLDAVFDDHVTVTLDSPKKIQDDNRLENRLLSFYIYKIIENADLRNNPPYTDAESKLNRSIALDVHFLLTSYGPDPDTILLILGRTQQLLHNAVLSGSLLEQSLEGTDQNIKITQQPLSQELITQMWQAMESSMRLALYYLATPIIIDLPSTESAEPVLDRQIGKSE